MQTLKAILNATDFSDLAANAFHAAFALARAHGARLILLYVKEPQETTAVNINSKYNSLRIM